MRRNQRRSVWLGVSVLAVLTLSPALFGQASPSREALIPVPNDWSHRSLIFSRPTTTEQARRVQQDPRYWQQRYRGQLPAMVPAAESRRGLASELGKASDLRNYRDVRVSLRRGHRKSDDWAEGLGSGASVGAGNYPAKFSFLGTSANCGTAPQPDFVIYSTGLEGSISQASVVAYDNLYSGCGGTVPSVYWAYNTSGQILTSPVYSLDGSQVAFVQTNPGDLGTLVLLKWAASTTESVGSPAVPTLELPAAYPGCSAPCMTTSLLTDPLATPADDRMSSFFYDYSGDAGYVGDNHGWLHKFSPVFNGPLAEVTTGGWPVQVNPTNPNPLASPVHESASGNVFVGDAGGFLYRVSPTGGVTISGQLDFGTGIVGSPEVDSTAGLVYVFSSSDGSADCSAGTTACAAVFQLTTTFAAGNTGFEAEVGASVPFGTLPNPNSLYNGDFDSEYKNSADATGNLYVCGNTGGAPTVYQVAIQAGAMGTVNIGPALASSGNPACSPVTDILNSNIAGGATEWIFASAQANGTSSACAAGGCIFNFKDMPWQPSTGYTAGQEILDSNFHLEVVKIAGTSGSAAPFWKISTGSATTDGGVTWLDQGVSTAVTPAAWISSHAYGVGTLILDTNNNIQRSTIRGTSGTLRPTWNTTVGGTTTDGTSVPPLTWTNLGVIATAALPAAGGTSGIIIDNTVGSGTLPGTSQVYFSTLSNQTTCGTSSSVGCAVQASQAALQ